MAARTRRYTILRDGPEPVDYAGYESARNRTRSRSAGTRGGRESLASLETEDLTERDIELLRRENASLAAAMRMSLHRPVARVQMEAEATLSSNTVTTTRDGSQAAWGVSAVGADEAPTSGAGTSVAVLDTGLDVTHPAFQGTHITARNFTDTGGPTDVSDRDGHGTHVAGTIFGRDVDGVRIGVAQGVTTVLIGKVLGDDGSGTSDGIFRGFDWAIREGVDVVCVSIGFDFVGQAEDEATYWGVDWKEAISNALNDFAANLRMFDAIMNKAAVNSGFDEGALVFAASGNERKSNMRIRASLPASAQDVIAVGALERAGDVLNVSPYSNTDPDICGPGTDILSARSGGGLETMTGTSMACPHAAGVAAHWWDMVRTQPVRARADMVRVRMMNALTVGALAPDAPLQDRGNGMVSCPLPAFVS